MVLDRRCTRAGVLVSLLGLAVAGCGGSQGGAAQRPSASLAGTATSAGQPGTSSPSGTGPMSTPPAGTGPAASPITIPPYLCTGTDIAQNAADAYLGALSAGNAKQAFACVLPNTVPAAVTRSLLATATTTAAYLPRNGVDGPTVFGYQGNGKLIDVTVTKEPDGRFWITGVSVRSG